LEEVELESEMSKRLICTVSAKMFHIESKVNLFELRSQKPGKSSREVKSTSSSSLEQQHQHRQRGGGNNNKSSSQNRRWEFKNRQFGSWCRPLSYTGTAIWWRK
jgi:hypothetical protein